MVWNRKPLKKMLKILRLKDWLTAEKCWNENGHGHFSSVSKTSKWSWTFLKTSQSCAKKLALNSSKKSQTFMTKFKTLCACLSLFGRQVVLRLQRIELSDLGSCCTSCQALPRPWNNEGNRQSGDALWIPNVTAFPKTKLTKVPMDQEKERAGKASVQMHIIIILHIRTIKSSYRMAASLAWGGITEAEWALAEVQVEHCMYNCYWPECRNDICVYNGIHRPSSKSEVQNHFGAILRC